MMKKNERAIKTETDDKNKNRTIPCPYINPSDLKLVCPDLPMMMWS